MYANGELIPWELTGDDVEDPFREPRLIQHGRDGNKPRGN
jgi:hypothetical protein